MPGSEPKWTPGPWERVRIGAETGILSPTSCSGRYLAMVDGDANASLIAAAPELYEALERGLNTSIHGNPCGMIVPHGAHLHCVRYKGHDPAEIEHAGDIDLEWTFQARAALAKARGEKPDAT